MTLNEIFSLFSKIFKKLKRNQSEFKPIKFKYFFYLFSIIIFSTIFITTNNWINQNNKKQNQNFNSIVKNKEFINLSDYLISKVNSPYIEVEYLIQNNDSVEKILNKFDINASEIKVISKNLKQKKLTNIYAGRKLSLILKKLKNGENSMINLIYPISNTLNIEIRKNKKMFLVKENVLQVYKKEVVIKSEIKNNLYSAAVESGIEPNIIVEFARIFGFEVDFQRDIRKGDWFEILYERFEDDNNIVQDTGKIIYASMYVNGEEINLYNFKSNNEIGY
jgi:hypothetical protein